MERITSELDWQIFIRQTGAIKVKAGDNTNWPDGAVWFETKNFGWILSAKDELSKRRIVARF